VSGRQEGHFDGELYLISQPSSPYQLLRQTLAQRGLAGLYAGCPAVVVGNAVKAGVRFTTYDQFKQMLSDDEVCQDRDRPWSIRGGWGRTDHQGRLTAPRSMLAGLGAGMMEAIIAVTPSETIKWVTRSV
jgi:solute carrier family 25 citrate transporter 1